MEREEKVEGKIVLQPQRGSAAGHGDFFKRPALQMIGARTGVDAQERIEAGSRKSREFTAGEGHSIDLIEAIRKEGDSRRRVPHGRTSSPCRNAPRRTRRT